MDSRTSLTADELTPIQRAVVAAAVRREWRRDYIAAETPFDTAFTVQFDAVGVDVVLTASEALALWDADTEEVVRQAFGA